MCVSIHYKLLKCLRCLRPIGFSLPGNDDFSAAQVVIRGQGVVAHGSVVRREAHDGVANNGDAGAFFGKLVRRELLVEGHNRVRGEMMRLADFLESHEDFCFCKKG